MISYSPRQCYYKKRHMGMILLGIRGTLKALAVTKAAISCIVGNMGSNRNEIPPLTVTANPEA
jgi:hypothetical protein